MIGNKRQVVDWLTDQPEEQQFEIKKRRKPRSLNANSYAWVLIGEIADALRTSKDEIYLKALEDYGQSIIVPVQQGLEVEGLFKYCKLIREQELNGHPADWYKIMKGSSQFDTREMSIFLDGIVSDAKDLDIETMTPAELNQLKDSWHSKGDKNKNEIHNQQ